VVWEVALVWPTRVRRREQKHAFEAALEDARLDPDGQPILFEESAGIGPAIGSLGDIATASGYVAHQSLANAYSAERDPIEAKTVEPPGEAARKLKELLTSKVHSPGELRRFRRRFAAQNHPDRVPAELRAEALAAMAEVNAEIDRALKTARPS
jgi:hypothetical protein